MTWTLVKGHKGPVKGLRASRPQGLDPLFTHHSPLHQAGVPFVFLSYDYEVASLHNTKHLPTLIRNPVENRPNTTKYNLLCRTTCFDLFHVLTQYVLNTNFEPEHDVK
jgi:hypothetical protein